MRKDQASAVLVHRCFQGPGALFHSFIHVLFFRVYRVRLKM